MYLYKKIEYVVIWDNERQSYTTEDESNAREKLVSLKKVYPNVKAYINTYILKDQKELSCY